MAIRKKKIISRPVLCFWPLVFYYQICFLYGLKYLELNFESASAAALTSSRCQARFFSYLYGSIKKIEDGNLCEICLLNCEITAIFTLKNGRQELSTSGEKCSHSHSSANLFVCLISNTSLKIRKFLQEPGVLKDI